jgi:hypothetical protein
MPYFIRSTRGLGQMLVEDTRDGVRRKMQTNLDTHYSPVSAREAHEWVLDGKAHDTTLFVDSGTGRIRRLKTA